jgi:hypothetical protein
MLLHVAQSGGWVMLIVMVLVWIVMVMASG